MLLPSGARIRSKATRPARCIAKSFLRRPDAQHHQTAAAALPAEHRRRTGRRRNRGGIEQPTPNPRRGRWRRCSRSRAACPWGQLCRVDAPDVDHEWSPGPGRQVQNPARGARATQSPGACRPHTQQVPDRVGMAAQPAERPRRRSSRTTRSCPAGQPCIGAPARPQSPARPDDGAAESGAWLARVPRPIAPWRCRRRRCHRAAAARARPCSGGGRGGRRRAGLESGSIASGSAGDQRPASRQVDHLVGRGLADARRRPMPVARFHSRTEAVVSELRQPLAIVGEDHIVRLPVWPTSNRCSSCATSRPLTVTSSAGRRRGCRRGTPW